jgi:hypothetical protein
VIEGVVEHAFDTMNGAPLSRTHGATLRLYLTVK